MRRAAASALLSWVSPERRIRLTFSVSLLRKIGIITMSQLRRPAWQRPLSCRMFNSPQCRKAPAVLAPGRSGGNGLRDLFRLAHNIPHTGVPGVHESLSDALLEQADERI